MCWPESWRVINCAMEHLLSLWPSCLSPWRSKRCYKLLHPSQLCPAVGPSWPSEHCLYLSQHNLWTPPLQPAQLTEPCFLYLIHLNIVGGNAKSLYKVRIIATHCSSLVHKTNNFTLEVRHDLPLVSLCVTNHLSLAEFLVLCIFPSCFLFYFPSSSLVLSSGLGHKAVIIM